MKTIKSQRLPNGSRHALRAGFTVDEIFNLTKIDRWFLVQIKEIVDFEEELAAVEN
jgi:carbamoyl-phosphate synthase large subunit